MSTSTTNRHLVGRDELIVRALAQQPRALSRAKVAAALPASVMSARSLSWLSARLYELYLLGWLKRVGPDDGRGRMVRWAATEEAVAELASQRPGRMPRQLAPLAPGQDVRTRKRARTPASPAAPSRRMALPRTQPYDFGSGWRGVAWEPPRAGSDAFMRLPSRGQAQQEAAK